MYKKNKVTNSTCLKVYLTQTYYTNKNTLNYTTGQRNRNKKKKEASLDCNVIICLAIFLLMEEGVSICFDGSQACCSL